MSYQSLVDIANQLVADLGKLESNELSIADLDIMHQNARELSERLTILKYQAIEKFVKPEKEMPIREEKPIEAPVAEKEEVKPTIKFNIRPEIEDAPKNQTNLLDEIKERVEEDVEVFLEDYVETTPDQWNQAFVQNFFGNWFIPEMNPIEEDLISMQKSLKLFFKFLSEKEIIPTASAQGALAVLEDENAHTQWGLQRKLCDHSFSGCDNRSWLPGMLIYQYR